MELPFRVRGDKVVRNKATPEGRYIGKQLAKWCDDAEPTARLELPELPPRCKSCALRAGNHVANGSPHTQMLLLEALVKREPFYCHQPDREGDFCSGWAIFLLAQKELPTQATTTLNAPQGRDHDQTLLPAHKEEPQ